jgi:hypothetical protein
MLRKIITTKIANKKESLTTKLTLIIIGLTAGSALLIPATYASFHPVTTGEIADNTIQSRDISNTLGVASVDIRDGQVGSVDIGTGQVASVDIQDSTITYGDLSRSFILVAQREDCNCGGTGWDPSGSVPSVVIYDDRITTNSVVSVTMPDISGNLVCGTQALSAGEVAVRCNQNIPNGQGVNYAIFDPQF